MDKSTINGIWEQYLIRYTIFLTLVFMGAYIVGHHSFYGLILCFIGLLYQMNTEKIKKRKLEDV